MKLFSPVPPIDHPRIVAAIGAAEQRTSGEIRILIGRQKTDDPLATARAHFERLGMAQTKARNGVLIFLAPASRNFAIIGDAAIHEKCGDAFWRLLAAAMELHFKRGEFTAGLLQGIERAGSLLAEHFPPEPRDQNELSDTVEEG